MARERIVMAESEENTLSRESGRSTVVAEPRPTPTRRTARDLFGPQVEAPTNVPNSGGERVQGGDWWRRVPPIAGGAPDDEDRPRQERIRLPQNIEDMTQEDLNWLRAERELEERRRVARTPDEFEADPDGPQNPDQANESNSQRTMEQIMRIPGAREELARMFHAAQEQSEAGQVASGSFERDLSEMPGLDEETRRRVLAGELRLDDPIFNNHYEQIVIDIGTGIPRRVEWPVAAEGKLNRARRVLNQLEDYEEGSDAPGLGPRYREVEAVVTALMLSPDARRREHGRMLRTEEKARISLHQGWLGVKLAENIDGVRDALKNTVWFVHIAWAMQQDAVIEALQYLEDHGDEYVECTQTHADNPDQAKPPAKLEAFKQRALGEISKFTDQYNTPEHRAENQRLEKLIEERLKKPNLTDEEKAEMTEWEDKIRQLSDAEAAYRIAERIWIFTGRQMTFDRLTVKTNNNQWDFVGDAKGGPFQMRRLMLMTEWLYTQYGEHWFPELMSYVDMVTPDWFDFNAPMFTSNLKEGNKAEDFFRYKFVPIEGEMYVTEMVGDKKVVKIDPATGKPMKKKVHTDGGHRELEGFERGYTYKDQDGERRKLPPLNKKVSRVNFRAINWKKVNFMDLAERPFDFWTYRKLADPERFRRKLIEKFLKDPTPENLFELHNDASYLGNSHWDLNKNMLENLLTFMEKFNKEKLGRGNIKPLEKDAIIRDALDHHHIRTEDVKEIEREMLGWMKIPRRIYNLFMLAEFLLGVVKKAIEESLKFSI